MLRFHEKRLRSIFGRALIVALAAPAAINACNRDSLQTTAGDDAGGSGADGSVVDALDEGDSSVDPNYDAGPCGPMDYDAGPDGADLCAHYVSLACGVPADVTPRDNCFFLLDDCAGLCGQIAFNCHSYGDSCVDGAVVPLESGAVIVDCIGCPGGAGRRPRGLVRPTFGRAKNTVGDYFARAAHLEGASVQAFEQLEGALRDHGAPNDLCKLATRAARDEVRHARVTSRLAKRFGGVPAAVRVRHRARKKSLAAIALENLVEGCIRETYGALVVTWQAAHTIDPDVAQTMTRIAEDETRHAALSWAIDGWARTLLTPEARRRLATRGGAAIAELEAAIVEPTEDLVRIAGLPSAARQRVLLRELAGQLLPEIAA